jgi:hypothetical protein
MEMPADIRETIANLGLRTGVLSVWDGVDVVRLIKARHAYRDLPYMFRGIPQYDHVRWNGCEEHMLDDYAEELREKYGLDKAAVLRPKVYYVPRKPAR